jgi:hypothetical protein
MRRMSDKRTWGTFLAVLSLLCGLQLLYSASWPPAAGGNLSTNFYTTTFLLRENPISENSKWLNGKADGIDWRNVRTIPGLAFFTRPNVDDYRDSTAILKGTWGANQFVRTVVRIPNPDTQYDMEMEIRLRSSLSAHRCTGYEVIGGSQIVRWNGPLGDFTILQDQGPHGALHDGDVFEAHMIGNVITVYINGVQVNRAVDSTFTTGNPGMGFFTRNPNPPRFGFGSFTASDVPF